MSSYPAMSADPAISVYPAISADPRASRLPAFGAQSLWLPCFAAILARLALLFATLHRTGTRVLTEGDTASYLEPAKSLLDHFTFAAHGLPELDRTPGYPIFLALSGAAGGHILPAVLLQILLSAIAVSLTAGIARQAFPDRPKIALIAAWLLAFEPVSVIYSLRLLPETLFLVFLLAFLDRFLAFLHTHRLRTLGLAGLWLTAATFTRPVSYYLPIFLCAGLAIAPALGKPVDKRLIWKAPAVLLLGTAPWFAAWQLRNQLEAGYPAFSTVVEKNLYFYQSAEVTARLTGQSFVQVQRKLGYPDDAAWIAAHPEQAHWPPAMRLRYLRSQALAILAAHPALYLRTHLTGSAVVALTPCAADLLKMLALYPDDAPARVVHQGPMRAALELARAHPGVAATMAALEAALLALYAPAVLELILNMVGDKAGNGPAHHASLAILFALPVYFLLVSGGAQAVGRYRLPVMPELCLLAAAGLARVSRPRKNSA